MEEKLFLDAANEALHLERKTQINLQVIINKKK